MKSEKVISLLLASILLVSSQLGIASTDTVNDKSDSNESRDEKISNAEKYFEWVPNIEVATDKLYLIALEIDKIKYHLLLELEAYTYPSTYLDPNSKEIVITIDFDINYHGLHDIRLYNYFDKEQEIALCALPSNFYHLRVNDFDLQGYLEPRIFDYITLGEVADFMMNSYYFDISDYYLKSRLRTLEDFEYNNTVPLKNDGLFIKKEDLFIMISSDDNNSKNDKFIFLRKSEIKDTKNYTLLDLFTDEKIAELKKAKLNFYDNSFRGCLNNHNYT